MVKDIKAIQIAADRELDLSSGIARKAMESHQLLVADLPMFARLLEEFPGAEISNESVLTARIAVKFPLYGIPYLFFNYKDKIISPDFDRKITSLMEKASYAVERSKEMEAEAVRWEEELDEPPSALWLKLSLKARNKWARQKAYYQKRAAGYRASAATMLQKSREHLAAAAELKGALPILKVKILAIFEGYAFEPYNPDW